MGLKVKDIIMIGAFSAMYLMAVALGTLVGAFFDHIGNMMYAPAFSAIFGGIIYMSLLSKIPRFGAISLLGLVMAFFFFLSGHLYLSFLPGMIFGITGDVIARLGKYRHLVFNLLSFIFFSFVNSGPILLMWVARDVYIQNLLDRGKTQDYVNRIFLSADLSTISWFVVTVLLGGILGGILGQYFVNKHLLKAGAGR